MRANADAGRALRLLVLLRRVDAWSHVGRVAGVEALAQRASITGGASLTVGCSTAIGLAIVCRAGHERRH